MPAAGAVWHVRRIGVRSTGKELDVGARRGGGP